MKANISIMSVIITVFCGYFAFAQNQAPILPASVQDPVVMEDAQATWLLGSDQGQLRIALSQNGLSWQPYSLDTRGLKLQAVRDLSLLRLFGSEQVVAFVATVDHQDSLYVLGLRLGNLELLFRTPLNAPLAKGESIAASRHYVRGPGLVRSFLLIGVNLVVIDWSPQSGRQSAAAYDLPFEASGLALDPAWADGSPRLLAWRQEGATVNAAYVVNNPSGLSQASVSFTLGDPTGPLNLQVRANGAGGQIACANAGTLQMLSFTGTTPGSLDSQAYKGEVLKLWSVPSGFYCLQRQGDKYFATLFNGGAIPVEQASQTGETWLAGDNHTVLNVQPSAGAKLLSANQTIQNATIGSWLYRASLGWQAIAAFPDSADSPPIPLALRLGGAQ